MGLLVDGVWQDRWYDTAELGGRFIRSESQFRNCITRDGSPGPSGVGGFAAEPDRYHLYVSLACPWAHRTLIFRALKGLESFIPISVVNWLMGSEGWTFAEGLGLTRPSNSNPKADVTLDGRIKCGHDNKGVPARIEYKWRGRCRATQGVTRAPPRCFAAALLLRRGFLSACDRGLPAFPAS